MEPGVHPAHYGDPVGEYQAIRLTAGLWEGAAWGLIRLTGSDRLKFLHKYCTQAVSELTPGQGAYACCLTVKGALVADMWLFAREEDAILLVSRAGQAGLTAHLSKYALFDDVSLAPLEDWAVLSLGGPGSAGILSEVLGQEPALEEASHLTVTREEGEVVIARRAWPVEGFDLLTPRTGLAPLAKALSEAGAKPVGSQAVEQIRVEAGQPLFGVDMGEKTIPIEVGLQDRAISFEKGCYIGQEVVARIAHRGHVNRHLVGFRLPGDQPRTPPLQVWNDRKLVGEITSVAHSPLLGGTLVGIGLLNRKHVTPGTELHLGEVGGERTTVCALPFEGEGK